MIKNTFFALLFCCTAITSLANNDTTKSKWPIQRQLFHERIDAQRTILDKIDGKLDGLINFSTNDEINLAVTDAIFRQVTELEDSIETSEKIPGHKDKVIYLAHVENLLKEFRWYWQHNEINPVYAPMLVDNFKKIMFAGFDSLSMAPYLETVPYAIGRINVAIFKDNVGYKEGSKVVFTKLCSLYPDKILSEIAPFVEEPYADSLLIIATKYNPSDTYKYAQNEASPIGKLIYLDSNAYVKTIFGLTKTPAALLYFPFLDDIVSGKKNIDQLQKIIGTGGRQYDSVAYYKLLVKTEIEYSKRLSNGDTAVAFFGTNGLRYTLQKKAKDHFVTQINNMHEKPESIRMRPIEPLSSIDIYYMIVTNEDEIYTSSYKHSFNRMLQRLSKNVSTDSLLQMVNHDYFKKFIKMAANFNKLDTFLNLMPVVKSKELMKAFVANLETTNSLEDAVDVADSYSSIGNKKLLADILNSVKENEQRCNYEFNKRGMIIYSLLDTIFLSANPANNIDLSTSIGIPPIYSIDNKALMDDSGHIVQQVFFYGDPDGKAFFPRYISSFSSSQWKINNKKEWVEIKSIKKPNVWIYINRPLDNDKNLDDTAQIHLNNYMRSNDLTPSIVTHRGHSYWLDRTMDRMAGDAKIVILGSCGGYKNLKQLIDINPQAHIISTKEIGTGEINQYITNAVNQTLLSGKPIVWKLMWKNLDNYFSKQPKSVKEAWEDYVPPYKNLGAIFIKAYNKKAETAQ